MKVRVLYFAAVRDLAGRAEETLELPDEVRSIGALGRWLGERVPGLSARLPQLRFARNEAFAHDDEPVAEGDVIALIPPVAGGA